MSNLRRGQFPKIARPHARFCVIIRNRRRGKLRRIRRLISPRGRRELSPDFILISHRKARQARYFQSVEVGALPVERKETRESEKGEGMAGSSRARSTAYSSYLSRE